MATVPTVGGPSVQQGGLPDAYQSVSKGLGNAGAAQAQLLNQATQAGQAFGQQFEREQQRNDIDAVFRAETAMRDDYLNFEREELGKNGVNAKGATERANQWWGEARAKYGEGLTERQAYAFRMNAEKLRVASKGTLGRHEQHQADQSLKESAQARIGAAVDSAILDPTPERVEASKLAIREAVAAASNLAGHTPEIKAEKTAEAMSLMHKGIVMRLVDNDPDAAKAYFYGNKKEINGATQVTLEKVLERGGLLTEAQNAADEIASKFGDMGAAMKHIEETYSGEKEKAVKAEVLDRFTRTQQSKNQMSQTAYETALLHTVQGQKVPGSVWAQMDDGHKAAIIEKREAEAKARRAEAEGRAIKTDFTTWEKINRLAAENPRDFMSLDLGRYADKVSKQDLMEFSNLQRKFKTSPDEAKGAATLAQQIDATVEQLRLDGMQGAERRGQLKKNIYDALEQARTRGETLDYEGRQKIIDRQIVEVTVPGFIWGSTKRAYEVTPAEASKARIKVPADDRKLIEQALKAKGIQVTDDAVLNLYKRKKGFE